MRIAILSDSHDHRDLLHQCIEKIYTLDIDHIIHLWDYIAPWASLWPLLDTSIPMTWIFWNNDWERWKITKLFEQAEHATLHWRIFWSTELDWKKIFLSHFPDLAPIAAASWMYDVVLYWHNHLRESSVQKNWTIICNPGAVCWDKEPASFAVLDTKHNSIEHIEI